MAAALPPEPPGTRFGGHLAAFRRDRLGFLEAAAKHGDLVRIRFGPFPAYLLAHPDLVEEVLVQRHAEFRKDRFTRDLGAVLGRGLLTSEGELWIRQRKLIQPAFHHKAIEGYARAMVQRGEEHLAAWAPGQTRDIHHDMMGVTLRIVADTLFGADLAGRGHEVGDALDVVMDHYRKVTNETYFIPRGVPTPGNLRFRAAVRTLDRIVYGMIRERRAEPGERTDLLAMLLRVRDEVGGMSDQQLRDEMVTLLLAGHETTAIALSWTLWLLATHPEEDAALARELREVLGGRPPTAADLPRLQVAEATVKEGMRLYPPAWLLGREPLQDTTLGGYPLPARHQVIMSPWVLHRDPRYFAEPRAFRPARWTREMEAKLPRFAYFPFGGGPRRCIGNDFAMMEATLLLATIAQRFELRPLEGFVPQPWPSITVRPRYGVRVRVAARA